MSARKNGSGSAVSCGDDLAAEKCGENSVVRFAITHENNAAASSDGISGHSTHEGGFAVAIKPEDNLGGAGHQPCSKPFECIKVDRSAVEEMLA